MELMEIAFGEYGEREIEGKQDNPRIVNYFTEIGFDGSKLKDETAWCSAYANWVAKQAGFEYSGKLNAKSWLNVGKETEEPKFGDVVVLWREHPDSWKGHVGFFVRQTKEFIYILGGNQNNSVCVKPYDIGRLKGYRKLEKIEKS